MLSTCARPRPAARAAICINVDKKRSDFVYSFCNARCIPSRVFLKMGHDVIFSNSRFTAVFLHQKSMECILLVRYDGLNHYMN